MLRRFFSIPKFKPKVKFDSVPKFNEKDYPTYYCFEIGSLGFTRKTIYSQMIHLGLASIGMTIGTTLMMTSFPLTIPITIGGLVITKALWKRTVDSEDYSSNLARGYYITQNSLKRLTSFAGLSLAIGLTVSPLGFVVPFNYLSSYLVPLGIVVFANRYARLHPQLFRIPGAYAGIALMSSFIANDLYLDPIQLAFITVMYFFLRRTVNNSLITYNNVHADHLKVALESFYRYQKN